MGELSNWLHRDQETYPRMLYLVFATNNFFMRLTWAFSTLTPSDSSDLYLEVVFFVLSGVEIYRRAQWSVIRLENEHLRNPSKFRVIDWVPPLVPIGRMRTTSMTSNRSTSPRMRTTSVGSNRSNTPLQQALIDENAVSPAVSPYNMFGSPISPLRSSPKARRSSGGMGGASSGDAPVLPHHAPQKLHTLPPRANAMNKSSRITSAEMSP